MKISDIELYGIHGMVDMEPEDGSIFMVERDGRNTFGLGRIATLYGVLPMDIERLKAGDIAALDQYLKAGESQPGIYNFRNGVVLKVEEGVLGEKHDGSRGALQLKEVPPYSPNRAEAAYLRSVLDTVEQA
jgi:hypothetical protein